MSSKLQNSIWPNEGGTLGQIKVQIPDGVTTPWPTGDALINNFVYHKGKLVGFVDTKALIANSSKSTTFPYEYVNISLPSIAEGEMTYNSDQCIYFILNGKVLKGDIPSDEELGIITKKYAGCKTVYDVIERDANYLTNDIVDGVWSEGLADLETSKIGEFEGMFINCSELTTFKSDLSSLENGYFMFANCANLATFECSDLSSLTNGGAMFYQCSKLTNFTNDLSSLTNGDNMFYQCSELTTFDSDLSSLTHGKRMFFDCRKLTTFNSDLNSLTEGCEMFYSCSALTAFTSDLSSLTKGCAMFLDCVNLTNFNSNLSSLTNGFEMFQNCNLNTASVQNIADTIKDVTGLTDEGEWGEVYKTIYITIEKQFPDSTEDNAFKQIANKGWRVFVNGNVYCGSYSNCCGSSCGGSCCASLATLDETGETTQTRIPFYAKPIPSDEEHAKYVDAEGNFYNILGAQFIYGDDLSTYGMFICEEDAAANMRLTKKGEEIMEEIETA